MNTDTPRTDALERANYKKDVYSSFFQMRDFAWNLERELTTAREELSEWSILNGWGGTPEIINDFIKGQQTRIHYAQNLDEELTAVTEQRDELLRYNEEFRKETLICADCDAIRKEEYDQSIEQRDRLAVALKNVIKYRRGEKPYDYWRLNENDRGNAQFDG
jgi:hypothetical protein